LKQAQNILVITYWDYSSALISTYTLPYVRLIQKVLPAGSEIFLVTLSPKNSKDKNAFGRYHAELSKEGITAVDYRYHPFGLLMFLRLFSIFFSLLVLTLREKISTIHGWCTPGGAIGYILSVLTFRPLVLDSFEPHAESMVETGTWQRNGFAYRVLFALEKRQLRRAKHVIFAAEGMAAYAAEKYGVRKPDYFVKPACVNLELFDPEAQRPARHTELTDEIVCVYAGKFGGIYLDREVFDFFEAASEFWGNRFRVLLLTAHSADEILFYCRASGLDPAIITRKFVPHAEIATWMGGATFAICPVKPVPTKAFCTPIKNGEYWAMGLPVVITKNISDDSRLIEQEEIGYVLRDLSDKEYLEAVRRIDMLIREPGLKEKIRSLATTHRNFSIAEKIYQAIYA
jgi:glycosyltransferase involved in cell wall biosynthesis